MAEFNERARLRIRAHRYRGRPGFLVAGTDDSGRRLAIFTRTRASAERMRVKLEAREPITPADFNDRDSTEAPMKQHPQLTRTEIAALAKIVNERNAGSTQDFADAIGVSERRANAILTAADRGLAKLEARQS